MTAEEWRSISGFPDYKVSNLGRVMSFCKRWKKPRELRGGGSLYRVVYLAKDDGGATVRGVHTLVAEAFHGPRPEGMQIRHLNGDRRDNRAVNLAYGTASENAYDSVAHGVHPNASKVECIRGHVFDRANTYITPKGTRGCRKCRAWHVRQVRQRQMFRAANIRESA